MVWFIICLICWFQGILVSTFAICLNMKRGHYNLFLGPYLIYTVWWLFWKGKCSDTLSVSPPWMNLLHVHLTLTNIQSKVQYSPLTTFVNLLLPNYLQTIIQEGKSIIYLFVGNSEFIYQSSETKKITHFLLNL